jgi:transcriptional regulator with XRE-family HTH domain
MRFPIKIAIMLRGLLQFQVAAAAGMTETRLSRIVQGRAIPTADERKRLGKALGKTERELFNDDSILTTANQDAPVGGTIHSDVSASPAEKLGMGEMVGRDEGKASDGGAL